jgi:hypothetical protein
LIHQLAAFDANQPAGAYNTRLHQYLVVWPQNSSTYTTIAGDRISRLGAPIDNPDTTGDESLTNIVIGVVLLQGYALSFWCTISSEYLVTFTYSNWNDSPTSRLVAWTGGAETSYFSSTGRQSARPVQTTAGLTWSPAAL